MAPPRVPSRLERSEGVLKPSERQGLLHELKDYVGFGEDDVRLLVAMEPLVRASFPSVVADFYEVIERTPRALAVFAGGAPQIARQKSRLIGWLEGLFGGVYDDSYFELRARIGRVHVQAELEQRFMFGAMNIIRRGLHSALDEAGFGDTREERRAAHRAIDRILDLDLAIMLETYRDRYVEQQRAQERLATLGQVAASIGHELRNPLAVMSTSVHLLRRRVDDDRALRHVNKIQKQVELSARIIGDLLSLARDRTSERRPADFAAIARSAIEGVESRDEVRIDLELADLPPVRLDEGQIRQVLVNLLSNASQAMPEGGTVTVRAHLAESTLFVEVLDEGPGFDESARSRAFEPLFSTKTSGFGLGLALCKRIIERHDGEIEVGSEPESGGRVTFRIPDVLGPP